MRTGQTFVTLLLLSVLPLTAFALQPVSDEDLAELSGGDGIGLTFQAFGDISLDYMQFVDKDGSVGGHDPYGQNNDYWLYDEGVDSAGGASCESPVSACGALRMEGVMTPGQLDLQIHASRATIGDVNGPPSQYFDGGLPILSVVADWSGIELAVEVISGYELGVGSGGGKGSWGKELRLANVENAHLHVDMGFFSANTVPRDVGNGMTFDIFVGESTKFDIEFKDADLKAQENNENDCFNNPANCDSTVPGVASYNNNRLVARGISPVGGNLEIMGAVIEADSSKGLVVYFPTFTGSLEVGAFGQTDSGIMLNGEQAARVYANQWNMNLGRMTVRPH